MLSISYVLSCRLIRFFFVVCVCVQRINSEKKEMEFHIVDIPTSSCLKISQGE